ncbi:MAG: hypothetical protein AAFN59_14575, partial [Pseudomonadota bacterium]
MRVWLRAVFVAAVGAMAQPVFSADVALLLGNENYRSLPDYRDGREVRGGRPEMSRAGIAVTIGLDVGREAMRARLAEFLQAAPSADGVVVALSGRFVRTTQETYFLPVDAPTPSLAEIDGLGLPLSTVLAVLAEVPGRAILTLATDQQRQSIAPYLAYGLGPIEIPQGVTVVTGSANAVEFLLEQVIPTRGRDMMKVIADSNNLRVRGYRPSELVFTAANASAPDANTQADRLDAELWATVRELNTVEGYESYLERFPRGRFAANARAGITAIQNDPVARAERVE